MDTEGLVRALADRLGAVAPDGFHVTAAPDGIVWFSCDNGRFPGQKGNFRPGISGTHLRHNLVGGAGTSGERIVAAARQALDDLQDYVDEASQEPWPGASRPSSARARVREGMLECWYEDGGEVVLELEIVPLGGAEQ